jgi:hypothetical protein
MTSEQYRKAIDKLGFTVVGVAPWLGISRRQAQRLASGECAVPEPVAKLLRLVIRLRLDPGEVD